MHLFLARLIVVFVLFLILFPVLSVQFFIVWPWYGREVTVELLCALVPFNTIAALLLWHYYLCMMTDPGRVPEGWEPDIMSGEGHEVKKLTGVPRYCRTCKEYKPPRAHHCRQCGRCVLRMDHHCPWVNNCIGHLNYGHFLRFLFYVDLCCTYHLVLVTRRVFSFSTRYYYGDPSGTEIFFIVANYSTVGPVLLTVGVFSLYHFYGLLGNMTTIESWEKDKAATLKRHGKISEVKYPYDLGAWRNVTCVLGNNPLLWCCPSTARGTGLKYEVAAGDAVADQHSWPPRDPTAPVQKDFKLPASPWTYQNGDVNPNLWPSNAGKRSLGGRRASVDAYASALPPYHPDFEMEFSSQPRKSCHRDTDSESEDHRGIRIRRGSEGYEVRPVDREEMLRRHMDSRISQEGRYQLYDHEPEHWSD